LRSSAVALAVPISIPRYTCMESQLIISPFNLWAISMANEVLPEAVGPTMAANLSIIIHPYHCFVKTFILVSIPLSWGFSLIIANHGGPAQLAPTGLQR
jgi:hypothetical protein